MKPANKKSTIQKTEKGLSKRVEKAKAAYEKAMLELAPFLPKTQSREITTEGTWQKTSSLSLY